MGDELGVKKWKKGEIMMEKVREKWWIEKVIKKGDNLFFHHLFHFLSPYFHHL